METGRCFEHGHRVRVQALGRPGERTVDFPPLKRVRFSHARMQDLGGLAPNEYATPTFSNFPSIDSFAVVDKSLFEERARGRVLALFQMTVSDDHSVRGPDLQAVQARVSELAPGGASLPVVLAFVTTPDGVREPQAVLNGEGHVYEALRRF